MENQALLDESTPGSHRRQNSGSRQLAYPKYAEPAHPHAIEEPGPGLLLEYVGIVRRHKGRLILIASLGLLAALIFTLPQASIYQARASLEIQDLNEDFLNMRATNPTANQVGSYPPQYDLQTQAKILQSESVLGRVIAKLHLEDKLAQEQEKSRGRLSGWRNDLGLAKWQSESPRDEALDLVTKNLRVTTEPTTRLVEILYDSNDPQFAADFLNALTAEFIQQSLESRVQTSQQTSEWLTQQTEGVRIKLEKSQEDLQAYAQSSGLLFTSEKVGPEIIQDNVAEEKLRQLQEQLSKAHGDRVTAQSQYELISKAPAESLPQVLDDKTLAEYQVKLTDLRRQLAELSSSLTPAHPSVEKVQAQIATLESALEGARSNVVQRIQNEYESANRRENLLATNYKSQEHLVSAQAAEVAHYNILKSDVDTNRQLYDSMLHSVQEAAMTSALRTSNIRVVDPAVPPTRPYKPRIVLNAALGLLAGTLLGFVLVVMRERADRSIQAPGEASMSSGLPELGVIPCLGAEQSRYFAYYQKEKGPRHLESKAIERAPQVELITSRSQQSVLADCFRDAVTSILYAGDNGDRPRVIVLTSANPGEGKTAVASNLALALAEIGRPVLLIDGDLRKGRQHEIFQVSNAWGFSDLLRGKELPAGREQVFVGTGYPRLFLLPAGSPDSTVASLLHSSRTREFLTRMRQEFHTVIIDSPPMLHMADARVLGKAADAVVLVVHSAVTTREATATAVLRLTEDGTRVLGSILNDWDPRKSSPSGYGSGYRYYQSDLARG